MNADQASDIMTVSQTQAREDHDRLKHPLAWSILDHNVFKRIREGAELGHGEVAIRTVGWDTDSLAVVPIIVGRLETLGYSVRGIGASFTVNWTDPFRRSRHY